MTRIPTEQFSNGKLLFSIKDLNIYHKGSVKYLQVFKVINTGPSLPVTMVLFS